MPEVPETLDGAFVLHDFRVLDRAAWQELPSTSRQAAADELRVLYEELLGAEEQGRGSSGVYRVVGHKADLLFLSLRDSVEELAEVEAALDRTRFAAWARRTYSYLSVVELSTHGSGGSAKELRERPEIRERLYPRLPRTRYLSFYPMSKRRGEAHNWYLLTQEERRDLMRSHGAIGRKYQGVVRQIISGSMGLDDWEWGVDLFSDDALAFKKIVYEMRFDEVSARYGLFGPFFTCVRLEPSTLAAYLHSLAPER